MRPVLDIVSIHYNADALYASRIERYLGWDMRPGQVIIVDNSALTEVASSPSLLPLSSNIAILREPTNPGYGPAVNRALTVSNAPYVLLVTQDAIVSEKAALELVKALDSNPGMAVAAPLLTFSSNPDLVFSAGGSVDKNAQTTHYGWKSPASAWQGTSPFSVDWADGAVLLCRREALDAAGHFDPRFFLYYEEVELQLRLRLGGWYIGIIPSAVASQEPGYFTPYLRARNRILLTGLHPKVFDTRPRANFRTNLSLLLEAVASEGVGGGAATLRGIRAARRGHFGKPPIHS